MISETCINMYNIRQVTTLSSPLYGSVNLLGLKLFKGRHKSILRSLISSSLLFFYDK